MNWSTPPVHSTSAPQEPPRFTVITDPVDGVSYTLDERMKEARRNPAKIATQQHLHEIQKLNDKLLGGANSLTVESLGTRQFDGVTAEGTRITTTIAAGQIGNLNPINVVSERWFSKDLQMAVRITRRDPRSGETVYRLTNIVRTEPPPDLFTVPSDYRIVDMWKKLDDAKVQFERELKKVEKARSGQE